MKLLKKVLALSVAALCLCFFGCNEADVDDVEHYTGEDYYADYVDEIISEDAFTMNIGADARVSFLSEYSLDGMPDAIDTKIGETLIIPDNAPQLEGYDFGGWSDGERYYYAGDEYAVCAESTALTARWIEKGTSVVLNRCDTHAGWWSDAAVTTAEGRFEGDNSIQNISATSVNFCYALEDIDLSAMYEFGEIRFSVWVEDASKMKIARNMGKVMLSHTGNGVDATVWDLGKYEWQSGWNDICLSISETETDYADFSKLNYFRFFYNVSDTVTVRLNDISFHTDANAPLYSVCYESGAVKDEILRPSASLCLKAGESAEAAQCSFSREGYDFAGWINGDTVVYPGDKVTVSDSNILFRANWVKKPEVKISFDTDGGKGSIPTILAYDGKWVTLPSKTPVKAGYSFAGWECEGKRYTPGQTVIAPDADLTLKALWDDIVLGDFADGIVEGWNLNDGGTLGIGLSNVKLGADGDFKWVTWLNSDTFGRTADFSIEGSLFKVADTKADLSGDFAISAWIKAPVREDEDRVIIAFCGDSSSATATLCLDASSGHSLSFEADGISGLEPSGAELADGLWHHVAISREGNLLTYYVDGEAVKTCDISGNVSSDLNDVYIGSDAHEKRGFDGSIAQVRIYNKAKTPDAMTDTVISPSDNQPNQPRLTLEKGLAFDRRQLYAPRPFAFEGQTVTRDDIINAKNMGFDHVKLLLTPNHLITEDGSLIVENLEYFTEVVSYVIELDYVCYICIHPEGDFKPTYLGDPDKFEILCRWYGQLASYVGDNWDADHVGIQLMTEPHGYDESRPWSWYSDRMWSAVRNVLPDHTILTNTSGMERNIELLKTMSPATDDNLIYTFTTYEPYTIGWYYYGEHYIDSSFWKYLKDIPYPVEEGVDYSDVIKSCIELVPDKMKAKARDAIEGYLSGEFDGKDVFGNLYGSLYNAEWHMLRAKSLDDWRQRYGGNIHIMCVEWGCMDNRTVSRYWNIQSPEGSGISDDVRLDFTRDMRASFDAYDIGWTYWSYNELHTVFLPELHYYGESPDPETAIGMFDWVMLEDCLGLKPLVDKPE